MTREILFRGKRIDNGEWVTGSLVKYAYDSTPYIGYLEMFGDGIYEVDPDTVGQYTELCDKNGKKIFEGDILRTNNSNCEIWTVSYIRGAFSAEQTNANYKCALGIFMMTSQVEVIGNIHDNPELIQMKEAEARLEHGWVTVQGADSVVVR